MTVADTSRLPWDLAGLAVDGSPVAANPWDRPPRTWIRGDRLHWRYVLFEGDDDVDEAFPVGFGPIALREAPQQTRVERGALLQFLNLPTRSGRAIASFASRWGVLHLCDHGLPRTHPQRVPSRKGDRRRDGPYCQTVYGQDIEGSEPLDLYIMWATRARAVLNIASTLDGRKRDVDPAVEWPVLFGDGAQAKKAAADADVGRRYLERELDLWFEVGAVRPQVELGQPAQMRVGGPELFGVLAVQLAAAVTSGAPTICSSCGDAYVAPKQPSRGRRNYCDSCRKRGSKRDASRDYRRRRAARGVQNIVKG